MKYMRAIVDGNLLTRYRTASTSTHRVIPFHQRFHTADFQLVDCILANKSSQQQDFCNAFIYVCTCTYIKSRLNCRKVKCYMRKLMFNIQFTGWLDT